MATQLLIYEKVVPVSKDRHTGWSVKAGNDYSFAKHINSVPVLAVEFASAADEYTLVFAGNEDGMMPIALLGIKERENLFVNESNHWDAKYIPAFIRRYPFVFSESEDRSTFTLCIDEDFVGCNQDNKGERLFDAEGERTQYLDNMLRFVNEYQGQNLRTQAFCQKLRDLDLLEPMQAEFTLTSGQRSRLAGFFAVNRERLKRLNDEQVIDLFKLDELELIYLHLQSMRNFTGMLERSAAHNSAPAADADKPAEAAIATDHAPDEKLH